MMHVNAKHLKPYALSLISTAIPHALGFLFFPLYAKALGALDYGVVALLEAYQSIFSILLFAGMTTAFYVYYSHAKDSKEKKEIFATSFFFSIFILIFMGIVTLFSEQISAAFFREEADALFLSIYAFSIFSDYLLTLINAFLRVEEKIGSLAISSILISLVHHGLNVCFVVIFGGTIENFISILFITKSAAIAIALYQMYHFKLSVHWKYMSFPTMWKMLKFGTPLILTSLTSWILLLSDRLFIQYYVTMTDVGIYAVAYKFAMGLWIGIVQPFMVVWEPSLFKVYCDNAEKGYLKLKRDFSFYLAGIVVLFSAFILLIKDILDLIFAHSEYGHEEQIIYLLAGSYFLMAVGEMCASVCRLNKTSRFALWVTLAALSTKIFLNITWIPSYLLVGAAAASVCSEIISQIIMAGFAVKLSRCPELFFSFQNSVLFSLFIIVELFLFYVPEAALWAKIGFFLGLLTLVKFIFSSIITEIGATLWVRKNQDTLSAVKD